MPCQQAGKEDSITGSRPRPTIIAVHLLKLSPVVNWLGMLVQMNALTGAVSQAFAWLREVLEGNHIRCLLLNDFDASEKTNKRLWVINHQLTVKCKI